MWRPGLLLIFDSSYLCLLLHHLKRIQSFPFYPVLQPIPNYMQCTGNTLHCDHNSGHIYQVFGQNGFNCTQHWQCSELYFVPANNCSRRQLPPTFPCLAVALVLLVPVIGNWYSYPHRRTADKGTSILSLGGVVGNENKSKTFSQKHSCSVDNLSCHHYLILLSTRKRHQVPPKNVSIDVKNEEL